jgi:hypothetical protein
VTALLAGHAAAHALSAGNRNAMAASNTLAARFAAPLIMQAINCFSLKNRC